MLAPGSDPHGGGDRLYPHADCRGSRSEPAGPVAATVRALELATAKRRTARDGVPGADLTLHRVGLIELPPVRYLPPNPLSKHAGARRKAHPVAVDTTPLCVPLAELRPLAFHQVRRTGEEALFNTLLECYPYLGYRQPVGEHLKYLVYARGRPIACLACSSAPRHLGPRDRFIGWSAQAPRRNIHWVAYHTRFLILPFVEVAHLASHLLSRMAQVLPRDWAQI